MTKFEEIVFCNDGSSPLKVPGIADVDFRYELPFASRFSTAFDYAYHPNITVRELAVLRALNDITDKADWAVAVLGNDCQQLSSWHAEARAHSELINDNAWNWIVRELRDKAIAFHESGSTIVYDTGAMGQPRDPEFPESFSGFSVYKSDRLVPPSLSIELEQETRCFFTPASGSGFSYQVDPSLYPLAFNRTPVLTKAGEFVTLDGQKSSSGASGSTGPAAKNEPDPELRYHHNFSNLFQWLPCEVEFRDGSQVAITSYINNLHPGRHQSLYRIIEKMISFAIEPWNQVLVMSGRGRTPLRILTFGVDYSPRRLYRNLSWVKNVHSLDNEQTRASAIDYIERYYALPGNSKSLRDAELDDADHYSYMYEDWRKSWRTHCAGSAYHLALYYRWSESRTCPDKHPQMGEALTYDAWKAGQVGACIVPPASYEDVMATSYDDQVFTAPPSVDLRKTFGRQGLQVIVKMASVELTPADPRFAGSDWSVEGVKNEHIVAVAVCFYSVKNIDDPRIALLHTGRCDIDEYDYDQHDGFDLSEVLGWEAPGGDENSSYYETGQKLGTLVARQGRILAYPNHLMSKMEAFELQDKTKPGYLRSLVLCLVDPHYRICSTRNVPPQQPEYWFNDALEAILPNHIHLPMEIRELIRSYSQDWPIPREEAVALSQQTRRVDNLRQIQLWAECGC